MQLSQQQELYTRVNNESQARVILKPLADLAFYSKEQLETSGWDYLRKHGRFRRRMCVRFETKTLSVMQIPTQQCVSIILPHFNIFVLLQYQIKVTEFDLMVAFDCYVNGQHLVQALTDTVKNMMDGGKQLASFSLYKPSGNKYTNDQLVQFMLPHTGFNIIHQLIMIQQKSNSSNDQRNSIGSSKIQQLPTESVILIDKGQVFDVAEFSKGCLKVMENLILFTQNPYIRSIQLETNRQTQVAMLRMLDHRPLVQQLWSDTIQFTLQRSKNKTLIEMFTQEQTAALYNRHKEAIDRTFNQFVLGNQTQIIQPHPVRALIDHVMTLQNQPCFDLALYNMQQYTLNQLTACCYIAKNFLVADQHMTSNHGSLCFAGCPGSGKSKLVSILQQYFNGFTFQDGGKGFTEFQNFDIVSKSFIKAEEVELRRLGSADWKQLADLELSMKARVKNQQDVEVTKNTPIVITTNCPVYEQIIQKMFKDISFGAVHRRWMFIRYYDTWANAHTQLFTEDLYSLQPQYSQIYANKNLDAQLMNSIVACALLFDQYQFILPNYIIPYYTHCLKAFSQTLFGQMFMCNHSQVIDIVKAISKTYCYESDGVCVTQQQLLGSKLEQMQMVHILKMINDYEEVTMTVLDEELQIIQTPYTPLYMKILQLIQRPQIHTLLDDSSELILDMFLKNKMQEGNLYYQIYHQLHVLEQHNFELNAADDQQFEDLSGMGDYGDQSQCDDNDLLNLNFQ